MDVLWSEQIPLPQPTEHDAHPPTGIDYTVAHSSIEQVSLSPAGAVANRVPALCNLQHSGLHRGLRLAHSRPMRHPTITLFEKTAEVLDVQGSTKGLDDAIAQLAAWMDLALLSEDDWVVLGEVGAILYREGLRRRQAWKSPLVGGLVNWSWALTRPTLRHIHMQESPIVFLVVVGSCPTCRREIRRCLQARLQF